MIYITFSGVDGAGKSTILDLLKNRLEDDYNLRVTVKRQRPSVMPILSSFKYGKENAEKRSASNLPRKGRNNSIVSSYFRFAYYYFDYVFGHFIFDNYLRKSYDIVLYDRYYFDFIVDPRRANLVINENFVKFLYRFIYKPRFNFFLFAPVDTILSRKRELSEGDIIDLTLAFRKLFDEFGLREEVYCTIENLDIKNTLDLIIKELKF